MKIREYTKNRKVTCSLFHITLQILERPFRPESKKFIGVLTRDQQSHTEQIAMAMSVATLLRARKFREREEYE